MAVTISSVEPGSPAARHKVSAGDILTHINGNEIDDVLDYRFYIGEKKLELTIVSDEKTRRVTIRKGEFDDLGLNFDTYLMDQQKHCKNKCIFCFIDQLPDGMRESLYFKDDDSRLSFLFGNYITLTNITEHEVDRIIKMHISPVNVSVHTTNPELRVQMMKNPHAGESLEVLYRLANNGTKINCQLVLCSGINDGDELRRSLRDLIALCPSVQSIAAVPLGLTKYRQGLCELKGYDASSAGEVIDIIDEFGDECEKKYGSRIVYASDEFYIKAGRPLPNNEYYGDYAQLENGVGMCTLLREEFSAAVDQTPGDDLPRECSIATGTAVYPIICEMVDIAKKKWHNLNCNVYGIKNEFFGTTIDVTGLITGQDLIAQLSQQPLGERLLLSSSMFRSEGDMMLDNITCEQLTERLNVPIRITPNDGYELLYAMLGM